MKDRNFFQKIELASLNAAASVTYDLFTKTTTTTKSAPVDIDVYMINVHGDTGEANLPDFDMIVRINEEDVLEFTGKWGGNTLVLSKPLHIAKGELVEIVVTNPHAAASVSYEISFFGRK